MRTVIKKPFLFFIMLLACAMAQASEKAFNVLACEPEWAALAYALLEEGSRDGKADEAFNIYSATTHQQDPHHIQARPSLIAKARKADLLVCSGAELEVGWLPVLLRKSGNPNIQEGAPGHFMATEQVALLEKREQVDRSEGDVHTAGNPHVNLDPHRMRVIARALSHNMGKILPDKKGLIEKNLAVFERSMDQAMLQLNADAASLKGKRMVVHHNNWVYLFDWLGITKIAELEPKPGLPPTASHLASLLGTVSVQTVDLIIHSNYQNRKSAEWVSERTGVPFIELAHTVDDWENKQALPDFYVNLVSQLSRAVQNK